MSAALAAAANERRSARRAELGCVAVALLLHAAPAVWLGAAPRPAPVRITSEVELAPLPTPVVADDSAAREPEPEPEPARDPPPRPEHRARRAAREPSAPPAAARAPELLTAAETEPAPAEAPVRFVSGDSGRALGYGLVARGGTAERGQGAGRDKDPRVAGRGRDDGGERLTPEDRLLRKPRLLGHDGCRGYFPRLAHRDRGQVTLIATVRATGAIARLEIESEHPHGEGFAAAARACLTALRFEPALDESGAPAAARTRVRIRFTR